MIRWASLRDAEDSDVFWLPSHGTMSLMSRPALLIAAATLCLTSLGCAGSYRTRILLPLAGAPDRIDRELCDRECRIGHNEGDYDYLRCLVTCPGVVVSRDEACSEDDLPPRAICRVTDMDPTESRTAAGRSEGSSGGSFLGALVGAMAIGALTAATSPKSSGSSSGDSETAATSNATGKGSVPLPQPGPASTSKPSSDSHKKSEPKRGK